MKDVRSDGHTTTGGVQGSEQWSSEDKFQIVMEGYTMNTAELAEY